MSPINRNIARVYEAIAVGDYSFLCDFEDAVSRQEFIQEIDDQNIRRVASGL
jgi:hypothetical protein